MKKKAEISMREMLEKCDNVSRTLKALAHPQRLQILCHLSQGEKTVGEIEELCGASQSAVSQFLNRLKSDGFIDSEKRGQFVYYRISDLKIQELIQALYHIFCRK